MAARSPPSLLLLSLGLLQGVAAAPLEGEAVSPQPCKPFGERFYSEETQRCCYRCPRGFMPKTKCPTDPKNDCVKQCGSDQFLNNEYPTPRCEDCLSCKPERNLVQKAPCTHNSSRVCECKPGLYCHTRIPNTCARCSTLTTCKPGFGVKIRGTSDQDTVCEKCPPGTFSEEDSSTQTCKPPRVYATTENVVKENENTQHEIGVNPPLGHSAQPVAATRPTGRISILVGLMSSNILDRTTGQPNILDATAKQLVNESNSSGIPDIVKTDKATKEEEKDVTLLVAALLFAFLLCAGSVMLWKRRVCKKWIVTHKVKRPQADCIKEANKINGWDSQYTIQEVSNQAKICSIFSPLSPAGLDPEGAELVQMDGGELVEPAVRSHPSNCIEKIYIMRADTVIVGSVSEVPSGKTCPARGEEGICGTQEAAEETEEAMHYPEQETAFSPGSDITTPVEEEWDEKPSEENSGGTS